MNFLKFQELKIKLYIIPFLLILYLSGNIASFSTYQYSLKKIDEQNIALIDVNTNANYLLDTVKPEKGNFERVAGISDAGNYYDNSVYVIFKIYPSIIENSLCNSNSANTFITSHFSTDI